MLIDAKQTNGSENTFILKTYQGQNEAAKYYKNEVDAFRKIRRMSDASIISFYGSYIHGSKYNIILEYADKGTLEEYFRETSPPSKGEDIINFWNSLFKIIQALKIIHDGDGGTTADGPTIFRG